MKKVHINYFDEQEKPWIFFKISQKKNKNFKTICTVLDYSKPKIFSVGQPWWPTFFQNLPPNYFSAATALHKLQKVDRFYCIFRLAVNWATTVANSEFESFCF